MSALPGAGRGLRVLVGAVLVLLSVVPLYRRTAAPDTGLAGRATADIVAVQAEFLWSGFLVLALLALLGGMMLPPGTFRRAVDRGAAAMGRPRPASFALLLAALGFSATAVFTILALDGRPNLVDAMVQLFQARYLAEGRLATPPLEHPGFWFTQNTVLTPEGWVSQYPPGHTGLLAVGFAAGAVELVGAALMAVTAALTYLSLRRLLPGEEILARLAGLGTALSPFLIAQTGSYMSHGSAAALGVAAVYCALRARDGRALWGLALGAALGMLLLSRPLFALVTAFGVVAPIALTAAFRRRLTGSGLLVRIAYAVIGGLPFVLALLAYNAHLFGDPLEMGYSRAWGAEQGLGFRVDPWGNRYTPLAALAFTSADLTTLGLSLFEAPLPLVAFAGLWLMAARHLRKGEGLVALWAVAPVVANFFYWHHSYFMGPRMLAEATPAWIALVAVSLAGLLRMAPESMSSSGFRPRAALGVLLVLGAASALFFAPLRLARIGSEFLPGLRLDVPEAPSEPALVFVHGAWSGRVFGRLAAEGFSVVELETTLRQNDLCDLQIMLDRGSVRRDAMDLEARPTTHGLADLELFPGNRMTLREDRVGPAGRLDLPAPCVREAGSDRHGIIEVTPLFWRGDLPGLGRGGSMYVRDLGPELNRRLIEGHPERTPYLLTREEPRGDPVLLPYEAGIRRLWVP